MLTLVLMLEMPVSLGALREQMVALMVLRVASVELVKVLVLGLLLLLLGGGAWIGVCACVWLMEAYSAACLFEDVTADSARHCPSRHARDSGACVELLQVIAEAPPAIS